MSVPRLVVLTDRHQLPAGADLVEQLGRCADAGLSHVLLRELDLADDERARLARALRAQGIAVWSAHRMLADADGLHLPDPDGPHGAAARPAPRADLVASSTASSTASSVASTPAPPATSDRSWGRSCHHPDQVAVAAAEGAAWVTLSPVAPSSSKPGRVLLEPESLAGHAIPVLALGGVDVDNARRLREAGAHGVAVMGAVMRSDDPAAVTAALLEASR
ncbi:thiamine phosphate synthase [Nocardioides dubius]|uniref:Thiamine phosphate synthase/TenI domain-containing protein n=1 Tax=Nocardioides dubius TaxID=317019 RepID=A0ABP4EPF2_9ACTN